MTGVDTRPRECLLSLAALLLLLGLAGAAILLPWWSQLQAYDDRAAELQGRWERFQALNSRRPLLESRLQQVNSQQQKNKYYIEAATPAVAAAGLQKAVKQAVESSGGNLVSTQNLPAAGGKHLKIAIRVRMKSDVAALTEILHQLEGGRPLLFVDNLTIRSRKVYRRKRRKKQVQHELDVKFDISGYLREGAR